jgi:hypothetical protein
LTKIAKFFWVNFAKISILKKWSQKKNTPVSTQSDTKQNKKVD